MMRQGWQVLFLAVFVAVLFGCGDKKKKNDGAPRWDSFPVTIYTDPSLVPNNQAVDDFRGAMDFWEKNVGKKLFDYRGNWHGNAYSGDSVSENALYVQSPWSYAANIAAQTIVLSKEGAIQGAVIMVNPGTSFCAGDCTGQSNRTSMRKVFAHELGHFIGLGHSTDTSNVMYPDALPGGTLDKLTINAQELLPLVN